MNTPEEHADELAAYREGFAANVRRLREQHDPPWSQTELYDAARLHRTEIGRIENGQTEPRLATLHVLADALGVGLDQLIEGLEVPVTRKPPPPRSR
jgi:transcriptional regulator with XRE-family HTH domain